MTEMKYIKVKGGIKLVGKCCDFVCEICPEKKRFITRCPEIDRNREDLISKLIKPKKGARK